MARRLDAGSRRQQILDAAERTVERLGWYDTRMEDIASEARVTVSLLARHWASREALLEELRARLYERYRGRVEEAVRTAATDADAVHRVADAAVHFFRDHPRAWLIFLPGAPENRVERTTADILVFERLVTSRVAGPDGPLTGGELRLVSSLAAATVIGVIVAAGARDEQPPAETVVPVVDALTIGGLDALSRQALGRPLDGTAPYLDRGSAR